ncbi:PH domain-containing protein [Shewanella khirikhana]|uniref:PH domain-containing protein n=1 Tax=Shewanella khirikhana TaxID=1965282 RepID=UPI0030D4ED20
MSDNPWQRLSPWSVVSFTLGTAKGVLTQGYALIPIVFTGWKQGFDSPLVIGVALAVLLGIISYALIQYVTYRFRPGADKLEVRRGLWFVRKDELPFDKIQNVRLDQPFYFKPLKLCTLVVETAGSKNDEVSIAAMELAGAQRLKAHLLGKQRRFAEANQTGADALDDDDSLLQDTQANNQADAGQVLVKRSPKELIIFGLYHNNFVWFMVFAGSIMGQLPMDKIIESLGLEAALQIKQQGPLMASLTMAALAVLGYVLFSLLSVLFAFLKYHPYQLHLGPQTEPTLERSGGIIAHQQDALAMRRVQLLEFNQPPIARLLGRWTLFFRQVQGHEVEQHVKLPLLVPALTREELSELLDALPALPGNSDKPPATAEFLPISSGWLSRRLLLPALVATLVIAFSNNWVAIELALTAATLTALGMWLRYRHWGYRMGDGVIWHRSGLLGQSIKRIALCKVQHLAIAQSPGQRKAGFATLNIGLASGELRLPWVPLGDAKAMAKAALDRVRPDNHNWI